MKIKAKSSLSNPRITAKERGLLKGSIRRVFARSDLRRKVLDSADIAHTDSTRPRVRKWSRCPICSKATPKYTMVVDHIDPVIPVDKSFEELGMDDTVNRTWCFEPNLQPICPDCHKHKTKLERAARKANK